MTNSYSVWERIPLLIHVGLHKTATTWLQKLYFTQPDFAFVWRPAEIISRLVTPPAAAFDPATPRRLWRSFADRAEEDDAICVISEERLTSFPFFNRFEQETLARRIAQAFPKAKILITVREQDSMILSMYGQFVRGGHYHTLEEFLARPADDKGFTGILDYDFFKYDLLLDLYESLFGRGNILMAPYESFMAEPTILSEAISKLFGRPVGAPEGSFLGKRVNVALSRQARCCLRQANRFVSPYMQWQGRSRLNPNSIGYWANRLTPGFARNNGAAKDRRIVREAVGDYYSESNRRLAERLGSGSALAGLEYRMNEGVSAGVDATARPRAYAGSAV